LPHGSRSVAKVTNVPAPSKISPKLEKEMLAKAADGLSAGEIVTWFLKDHGIKISRAAIGKRLHQTRVERSEVAKAVVREHLTKTVVSDLDRLAEEQQRVERLGRRLYGIADKAVGAIERAQAGEKVDAFELEAAMQAAPSFSALAFRSTAEASRLAQARLHYSGADADDEGASEVAEAERRVRGRVDSIAASLREGQADPDDRDDS